MRATEQDFQPYEASAAAHLQTLLRAPLARRESPGSRSEVLRVTAFPVQHYISA